VQVGVGYDIIENENRVTEKAQKYPKILKNSEIICLVFYMF
jgi:hypothetical protein